MAAESLPSGAGGDLGGGESSHAGKGGWRDRVGFWRRDQEEVVLKGDGGGQKWQSGGGGGFVDGGEGWRYGGGEGERGKRVPSQEVRTRKCII